MKIQTLLKTINGDTLIEIVDKKYSRLYYGLANEMSKDDKTFFKSSLVYNVSAFSVEVGPNRYHSVVQIRLDEHFCN